LVMFSIEKSSLRCMILVLVMIEKGFYPSNALPLKEDFAFGLRLTTCKFIQVG